MFLAIGPTLSQDVYTDETFTEVRSNFQAAILGTPVTTSCSFNPQIYMSLTKHHVNDSLSSHAVKVHAIKAKSLSLP